MSLTNISAPRRLGKKSDDPRSPRRQRQVLHLHKCGPWCVLEALLDVAGGRDLDETLADFERLRPELYAAAFMLFLDEVEV